MRNKLLIILSTIFIATSALGAYAEPKFEFTNKEKSIAHYNIAVNFAKNDNFDKAIDEFTKAVLLDPNNYQAYYNLGVAYSKLNKYEDALNSYKQAVTLNPEDPNNYYNIAVCLSSLNKIDEAKAYFLTALSKKPDFIEARANLAMIYLEKNDKASFNKELAILQKQDPKTAEIVRKAANPIEMKK